MSLQGKLVTGIQQLAVLFWQLLSLSFKKKKSQNKTVHNIWGEGNRYNLAQHVLKTLIEHDFFLLAENNCQLHYSVQCSSYFSNALGRGSERELRKWEVKHQKVKTPTKARGQRVQLDGNILTRQNTLTHDLDDKQQTKTSTLISGCSPSPKEMKSN